MEWFEATGNLYIETTDNFPPLCSMTPDLCDLQTLVNFRQPMEKYIHRYMNQASVRCYSIKHQTFPFTWMAFWFYVQPPSTSTPSHASWWLKHNEATSCTCSPIHARSNLTKQKLNFVSFTRDACRRYTVLGLILPGAWVGSRDGKKLSVPKRSEPKLMHDRNHRTKTEP